MNKSITERLVYYGTMGARLKTDYPRDGQFKETIFCL